MKRPIYVLIILMTISCDQIQEKTEEQMHNVALRAAMAKFTLATNDLTLGKKERNEKAMKLASDLSLQYPPVAPIRKDSTDRIFRTPLPPSLEGIPFLEKEAVYETPTEEQGTFFREGEIREAMRNEPYLTQRYWAGVVAYAANEERRRGAPSLLLRVMDTGYWPEWISLAQFDEENLLSGFKKSFGDALTPDKTISYQGHVWQRWVPTANARKAKALGSDLYLFTSLWNNRFTVFLDTTDSTDKALAAVGQIVDLDWLSKLKRPVPLQPASK